MGVHDQDFGSPLGSSNLYRMISINKLYKEGKMYMNAEEIEAIKKGKLRQYLE